MADREGENRMNQSVNRRVAVLAIVFAALCAAAIPGSAQSGAQTRLDAILTQGMLRVGTTGDYKPFTFLDKATGEYSGVDIELAQNLGEALGVKITFVATAWPNLMKDFEADRFDIAMGGISVTLERQKKGFFSTPYLRAGKAPIARCEDKAKFMTLADIDKRDVKVIVNPGGTNETFVRGNLKNAQIVVHRDNTTIFDEIVNRNADLMITDALETRYQQRLKPALCAIHPDKPFSFGEMGYLMQRDVALKVFVDQWLHIATETGVFKTIVGKWMD
jgi:cyclohexadienyl dehydratase